MEREKYGRKADRTADAHPVRNTAVYSDGRCGSSQIIQFNKEQHSRLNGETEDEIRKDAEALAKLFEASNNPAPMASAETKVKETDSKTAAYKEMLRQMKGE